MDNKNNNIIDDLHLEINKVINHYTYFIETQNSFQSIDIYLSKDYKEANSIEKIYQIKNQKDKSNYITSIYRFKIYKLIQNNEIIKIYSKDINNKEQNEFQLSQLNPERNTFLFGINSFLNIYDDSNFNIYDEFYIYITYLKDILGKDKNSEEHKDLINSIINYLSNNKICEKIKFPFYITLFIESFNMKCFYNLLDLFFYENIILAKGIIGKKSIYEFKKIINIIDKE